MQINLAYCNKIAARGAYVEFDNFGHEFYVDQRDRLFIPGPFATDVMRAQALIELMAAGHEKQLLLSTDICHKNLLHRYGGWGYDHVLTNIVPMLREQGVTDRHINMLLKENPQKFLDIN
jgi:phosphotriesterase-related protein